MFERLISLVRQEQVSLFIGAGFSIEACAPSVYDLKEAILKEIHETHQKIITKKILLLACQTFL